jgi:hypothetical protein
VLESAQAYRKQGRIVILVVGKDQGGVPDQATAARNRPGEVSSPCQ